MNNILQIVLTLLLLAQYSVFLKNSDRIVKAGETIVLECITETDVKMGWSYIGNFTGDGCTLTDDRVINPNYKNKFELTGNRSLGDYHLKINNVSSKEAGICRCYQQGLKPKVQLIITLQIGVPPNELIILNNNIDGIINEKEDQMLNITCQVKGGNTQGKIKWMIVPDFKPSFSQLVKWPFAYLNFTTEYIHHGMNVTCVVDHDMLSAPLAASVSFNVLYKPKITISRYPAGDIKEGQDIKLECLHKSNPPRANITWVKDGIILSSDPMYEKTNMTTNDSGIYFCIVFNSLGKEEEDIVLYVIKDNDTHINDFQDLTIFLCFGILTLSFLVLVTSVICNICIHLHCKTLSKLSPQTVNNDDSIVNIEMTDMFNGYHTINEEATRQADNGVQTNAEIRNTNDSLSYDSGDQSAESDADEIGLMESDDYVNPYCTMIHNTVEVDNYKTLGGANNESDTTAINVNMKLHRSYENLKF